MPEEKFEVIVATLGLKIEHLADSFKQSIERLIDKIEHGDREGTTLFRLIEQRLASFEETLSPRVQSLEGAVAQHREVVESRLDAVESALKVAEGVKLDRRWLFGVGFVGLGGLIVGVVALFLRG